MNIITTPFTNCWNRHASFQGSSIALFFSGCTEEKLDNVTITRLLPKVVSNVETLDFGPVVVLYDSEERYKSSMLAGPC